jgi:hypothetical protein
MRQCGASGMFIPDPTFFHPGSRIPDPNCLHPGSRILIKELKYFNPKKSKKNGFLSSKKYDPGCSSRIPDPDADFLSSRIPDLGVKKAPNPGSRIRIRNTGMRRPLLNQHKTLQAFALQRRTTVSFNSTSNPAAVVPATCYHSCCASTQARYRYQRCCASKKLPQLLCKQKATKNVVPATSNHSCCASNKYHGCCASNKLPHPLCQHEATTAVVPARSYHSYCASKKLPQLLCQQQATTAVVPATSCHRFCASNKLPQVLCQRHSTKTVVPATSYNSCCASNKLP